MYITQDGCRDPGHTETRNVRRKLKLISPTYSAVTTEDVTTRRRSGMLASDERA